MQRTPQKTTGIRLHHGIPVFLAQLADAMASTHGEPGSGADDMDFSRLIVESAALHGRDLLRDGFTVAQVVHGYGDVCQIVTELSSQYDAPITAEDFSRFQSMSRRRHRSAQ